MIRTKGIFLLVMFYSAFTTIGIAQAPTISSFSPVSAGTNSSVFITGTNFTCALTVKFGGVPAASYTVNSSTSITARVGAGASGNVTVTTPSGTASKSGFVYLPPPTITSFLPGTCGIGTVVTIQGSGFTSVAGVRFGNVNASSFTVVSPTTITAVVGAGSSGYVSIITTHGSAFSSGFIHLGPVINTFTPLSGPDGTTLTITGANFTGTTSVTIGGLAVTSYNIVSSDTITAITAPGSSGLLNVTTPFGTGSIRGFNAATITSFSPTFGTIGSVVTIKGFNFTSATGVTFGGVSATTFTQSGDTSISALVSTGASGFVKLTTALFGMDSSSFFSFSLPIPQISSFTPTTAGPAAIVTIKGRYFTGTTTVVFGSTPASSFTVVNDSLITAVVSGGSSGSVALTNSYGTGTKTGFVFTTLPTITSFTPEYGPVGSIVRIDGANFNPLASSDTVYFGGVLSPVLTANSGFVTVSVPHGTGYKSINLSTSGLITSSVKPFVITFPGDSIFTPNSFDSRINFTAGYLPQDVVAGDFDGDGKPDLAAINYGDDNVSVYRNTSVPGLISFAPKIDFATNAGPHSITAFDMNGDNKLDIVMATQSGVCILKNTSTTGNISFAPYYQTGTGIGNKDIAVADFDVDGKPDIAVANSDAFKVTVFKNTSSGGVLSFTSIFDYSTGHPYHITAADLNGDGKPEFIINNVPDASVPPGFFSVFKNLSSGPGSFSFALTNYYYDPINIFYDITSADLDGDSKPDLAMVNAGTNSISFVRNISNSCAILFDTLINYSAGSTQNAIKIADLNGDKKPDLVAVGTDMLVFKNNSVPGIISFLPYVNYPEATSMLGFHINDLDMDGKNDIATANLWDYNISVLRNKIGPNLRQLCPPSATTSISASTGGTTYQWQLDSGSGFNNIADNSNYSGTNLQVLQLISIPTSWYGYRYRCVTDGINGEETELRFRNIWTGSINTQWENPGNWSCGTVPDMNTDVLISAGSSVINSNITIRSLSISPGATLTVNSGYTLTITH